MSSLENQIKKLEKEIQDERLLNRHLQDQISEMNKNFSFKIYMLESRMNHSILPKDVSESDQSARSARIENVQKSNLTTTFFYIFLLIISLFLFLIIACF
jgi:hypothetical protein